MTQPARDLKQQILDVYGHEPQSLDDLGMCVVTMIQHRIRSLRPCRPGLELTALQWEMRQHDLVNNSHSSPQGYPKNPFRTPDSPTGFPGWIGQVDIGLRGDYPGFASDMFHGTLTYPGTGGKTRRLGEAARSECFGWDYRFFDADWPDVAEGVDRHRTWTILKGDPPWIGYHRFHWSNWSTQSPGRPESVDVHGRL